jgi:hypothetical protein
MNTTTNPSLDTNSQTGIRNTADAREDLIQAQMTLAAEHDAEASKAVQDFANSLEASTGYPVRIIFEALPGGPDAYVEVAPLARLDYHLVHCASRLPRPILPHVLAHEFIHIQLAHQAFAAGKAREFFATQANWQYVLGLYSASTRHLQRSGRSPAEIKEAIQDDAGSLFALVQNCPEDLVVELRLKRSFPCLRAAQIVALHRLHENDLPPAAILKQASLRPRWLAVRGLALKSVRALFQEELCDQATEFAAPYRDTEAFPLALKLWQHWKAASRSLGPGAEFQLVDEFADILGLRRMYESRVQVISPE